MKNLTIRSLLIPFLVILNTGCSPQFDSNTVEYFQLLYRTSHVSPDKIPQAINALSPGDKQILTEACQHVMNQLEDRVAQESGIMNEQRDLENRVGQRLMGVGIDPKTNQSSMEMLPNSSVFLWAFEMKGIMEGRTQWVNTINYDLITTYHTGLKMLDWVTGTLGNSYDPYDQFFGNSNDKMLKDLKNYAIQNYMNTLKRNQETIIAPCFDN